jgi:cytochrome b6-f complex iron-sulfur subunit
VAVKSPGRDEDRSAGGAAPRRRFLVVAWLGLAAVALVQYLGVVVDFLRPRRQRTPGDGGAVVVAGPVERFELNSVSAFPEGKFYLVRLEDGGFLALSRVCTHLGCTVPWSTEEQRFTCPCHSSTYDIRGDVLSPPAPRALDLYPVRIENQIVKVVTGTTVRRNSFESAQVTRA